MIIRDIKDIQLIIQIPTDYKDNQLIINYLSVNLIHTSVLLHRDKVVSIVEVDLFLNVIVFLIFLVFGKELLFHIKTIQLLHPTILQRTNHSSLFRSIPTIQKQFLP